MSQSEDLRSNFTKQDVDLEKSEEELETQLLQEKLLEQKSKINDQNSVMKIDHSIHESKLKYEIESTKQNAQYIAQTALETFRASIIKAQIAYQNEVNSRINESVYDIDQSVIKNEELEENFKKALQITNDYYHDKIDQIEKQRFVCL